MNNRIIQNPFIISGLIPDNLFCDREEETNYLIKQIQNGRNTVIVSPRRMGKTGLIHHLFQHPAITDKHTPFFRFSCKLLCLGVDFCQAEEKEFEVLDTAQGLAESLDFRV